MIEWLSHLNSVYFLAVVILLLFLNSSVMVPPSESLFLILGFTFYPENLDALIFSLIAGVIANLAGTYLWFHLGKREFKKTTKKHTYPESDIEIFNKIYRPFVRLFNNILKRLVSPSVNAFDELGERSVFWLRLVPIVRSIVSFPAGYKAMDTKKFLLLSFSGILIWGTFWVAIGSVVRETYFSYGALFAIPLVLLVVLVYHRTFTSLLKKWKF